MTDEQERLMSLFNEALSKGSAEERDAFLTAACAGDEALRGQVKALLEANAQAPDFLGEPIRVVSSEQSLDEVPGTVIGRYKLLELIGEGGFGRVYMAEQVEPVRRKVALKIIKLGMDTREVVARFEAERQALALMDHPNIAQVHDEGSTPSGRPYFVMELVKGIPITEYCDQQNQPTAERLELFRKVCHAVQHAHQKGVIHRDLKPSNILVTEADGEALPKIIDFGVAKAIGQPLTDKTLFTPFEQMIGTPAYMSPEQAGLGSLDLDTRTDIYALGVLLYELLTGTTPVQRETLHQAALDEVRRIIRETEPPKPSTRLQTLGVKLTEVARHRHAEPSVLAKLVRGDLDWIVMKALEKDRRWRYDTADALAQDLERHLRHEPVSASPPSQTYRVAKFVRRHRMGVAMAVVVSVAVLVGLTLALVGFNQARRQRDRALEAEKQAAVDAATAKAVNEFLQQDLLAQADPENEPDRDLKLRTLLDRAAAKIEGRFTNQPLVEASVRLTLGQTYLGLGEAKAAEPHLRRAVELRTKALGPEHPETLKAMEWLGRLELELGSYEQAKLLRQFVSLAAIGDDRASESYEEAKRFLQGLWETERRVLGADHTNTLETQHTLAAAFFRRNRTNKAVGLLREVLEKQRRLLGPEHPSVLTTMSSLATLYSSSDQFSKAAEMDEELLAVTRRLKGAESPRTLNLMHNLANNYRVLGRQLDALPLLQSVVETSRRVLGTNHPSTLLAMNDLGQVFGELYFGASLRRAVFMEGLHRGMSLACFANQLVVALLVVRRRGRRGRWRHQQLPSLRRGGTQPARQHYECDLGARCRVRLPVVARCAPEP
jgi:eukaryotic-like serine/threonine-protein kinase